MPQIIQMYSQRMPYLSSHTVWGILAQTDKSIDKCVKPFCNGVESIYSGDNYYVVMINVSALLQCAKGMDAIYLIMSFKYLHCNQLSI